MNTEDLQKLFALAGDLEALAQFAQTPEFSAWLGKLRQAANDVGRAWSGSCLGYHANVYYADYRTPPAGCQFNPEFGLMELQSLTGSTGDWQQHPFEEVRAAIFARARIKAASDIEEFPGKVSKVFREGQDELLAALALAQQEKPDTYLGNLKEQAVAITLISSYDYARAILPRSQFTRDSLAVAQGTKVPAHFSVIAEITAVQNAQQGCERLGRLLRRAASYLESRQKALAQAQRVGTKVFIGHGRSPVWRDLKDFLNERLRLPWDEYNRVPTAGISNIMRLAQMLDDAAIAFLVMTAEDEQSDGTVQARLNVVHEAGLFQGRLGFTKAIVLLEEGCGEFSNIHGLGQIRFPKGNLKPVREDIRGVLEREGILEEVET